MQEQRVDERADQERDQTRAQFKALLLGNPNYFGNLPQNALAPQLPIQLDTFYEELVCVGYEPQLRGFPLARRTTSATTSESIGGWPGLGDAHHSPADCCKATRRPGTTRSTYWRWRRM
jgi:hypothetical protein